MASNNTFLKYIRLTIVLKELYCQAVHKLKKKTNDKMEYPSIHKFTNDLFYLVNSLVSSSFLSSLILPIVLSSKIYCNLVLQPVIFRVFFSPSLLFISKFNRFPINGGSSYKI